MSGPDARRTAVEALVRIERDGAYANLVLPAMLARSELSERDRAFATELVYGTTRNRRACDWFVDRFALGDLDPTVRAALRLGTYQLRMLGTPAHAAVSATVEVVPRKARGLVNAVLRKVATATDAWPSDAVRLSYPDWLVERLTADHGATDTLEALAAMNEAAPTSERADGYIQDKASQWVTEAVGAQPGERVLDLCAAPGGKATALGTTVEADGFVVAADLRPGRAGLIADNVRRLSRPTTAGVMAGRPGRVKDLSASSAGPTLSEFRRSGGQPAATPLSVLVADGTCAPFASGSFDRVLVDAPCSGLGSLRRRPDARWRIDDGSPERLASLQHRLLAAAADLVVPGGSLTYSVCTLTIVETTGVADRFLQDHPTWASVPMPSLNSHWQSWGSGAILLPQTAGTDGMAVFSWRAPDVGGDR